MLLSISKMAFSQVGFNNPNPDASSILDLKSTTKGLLIPRMDSVSRNNISSPADGLMVYDTDNDAFFFRDGSTSSWKILPKASKTVNGINFSTNVGINTNATTNALTVSGNINTGSVTSSGNIQASSYSLNATGNGPVPQGGIIMWNSATIPTGWAICDGTNGTPDLRDRFIVGSGNSYAIGNTGGLSQVTLTVAQLPSHNHSASVSTDGSHTHDYTKPNCGEGYTGSYNGSNEVWDYDCVGTYATTSSGSHTHTVTIGNTGSNTAHENRPPYYALYYIMKL